MPVVNCSAYVCCQVAVVENGDTVCREGVSGIILGVLGTYRGISRWDEGSDAIEFSVQYIISSGPTSSLCIMRFMPHESVTAL